MSSGTLNDVNVEVLTAGAAAVAEVLDVSLGDECRVDVCAVSDVYEVWCWSGGTPVEAPFALADMLFNFRQVCAEQGAPWLRAVIDVDSPHMWSSHFFFDGPLPWFLPEEECVEWIRVDVEKFPRPAPLVGRWAAGLLGVESPGGAAAVKLCGGFSRNAEVTVTWEE